MQINNLAQAKAKQIKVLYIATLVLFLPLVAGLYFLYLEDNSNKEEAVQPEQ